MSRPKNLLKPAARLCKMDVMTTDQTAATSPWNWHRLAS